MSANLRKALFALVLIAVLAAVLALFPEEATPAVSQDPEPVEVVNFPRVQTVRGRVELAKPVEVTGLARAATFEAVVSPVAREDTGHLALAGGLDASGFARLTVSVAGEVRGRGEGGRLGVMLLPASEPMTRAFSEGRILLPLEMVAPIPDTGQGDWVAASSVSLNVAFPAYRIYLYNLSQRSVAARVFVYLSR